MKKYYTVSFEYAEDIYCTNIAHAESVADVEAEYRKYNWVKVRESAAYEVEEARRRGMPIIEVEPQQDTPAEVEPLSRYERIRAYLDSLNDVILVQIHNAYCDATNNSDNCIYPMDDFDEIIGDVKPWEVAKMCFYGHEFNPNHEWFYFNGDGNLESLDYINDSSPIYTEDIADYIDRDDNPLDDDEIAAILEEVE